MIIDIVLPEWIVPVLAATCVLYAFDKLLSVANWCMRWWLRRRMWRLQRAAGKALEMLGNNWGFRQMPSETEEQFRERIHSFHCAPYGVPAGVRRHNDADEMERKAR